MPRTPAAARVYVLKVALDGRRGIWRRIAIRGEQTLDNLHAAIFAAFERYDEHLYSFYIAPPSVKLTRTSAYRNAAHYMQPDAMEGLWFDDKKNAEKTTIASLHLSEKQVFLYLFDYGDEWWHVITVENTNAESDATLHYPVVIARRAEAPPQYPELEEEEDDDDE